MSGAGADKRAILREKLDRLRRLIAERGLDLLLILDASFINYLFPEGFSSRCATVSRDHAELYVAPLDFERAHALYGDDVEVKVVYEAGDAKFWFGDKVVVQDLNKHLRDKVRGLRVGVDTAEHAHQLLSDARSIALLAEDLWLLRRSKSEKELELINRAVEITMQAINSVVPEIEKGVREYEVAAKLEHAMRLQGCEDHAFNTIVAFGVNTSYPHHIPTGKQYDGESSIIIDVGCKYCGYASDITRTIVPSLERVEPRLRTVIEAVAEALERATSSVKEGANASYIDGVARTLLRERGLAEYFVHGLGHGIGVQVHERPRIAPSSREKLVVGDVFTIEPGVYIPEKFGVRIENDVAVTEGVRVLSGGLEKIIEFKR